MLENILKIILKKLKENEIPLTKINIQKIVYFLREVGIPIQYKYEPYIYGPYSSELKSDLRAMEIMGDLSLDNSNTYYFDSIQSEGIDEDIINRIGQKICQYKNALGNDFTFDSMEKSGTIIYCIKALENVGVVADEENIISEFKNWKGNKYKDKEISKMILKIKPILQ